MRGEVLLAEVVAATHQRERLLVVVAERARRDGRRGAGGIGGRGVVGAAAVAAAMEAGRHKAPTEADSHCAVRGRRSCAGDDKNGEDGIGRGRGLTIWACGVRSKDRISCTEC